MSLQQEGFRFVYQDRVWGWVHPTSIKPEAIDATDMDDEEFEDIVRQQEMEAVAEQLGGMAQKGVVISGSVMECAK